MTRQRGPRDKIRTLERKLGFFTERGLSRSRNATLAPEVKRMLDGIDSIKKDYLSFDAVELRSSALFEAAWKNLFWEIGPRLWPEVNVNVWVQDDPELYPRPLVLLEPTDRSVLEECFSQLVLEKCITYQRNQAAKPHREMKSAAAREAKHREDSSQMPYDKPIPDKRPASGPASEHAQGQTASPSPSVSEADLDDTYDSDTTYVARDMDVSAEFQTLASQKRQRGRQPVAARKHGVSDGDSDVHSRACTPKRPRSDDEDGPQRAEKRPCGVNGRMNTLEASSEIRDQANTASTLESNQESARTAVPCKSLIVKLMIPRLKQGPRLQSVMAAHALNLMQIGKPSPAQLSSTEDRLSPEFPLSPILPTPRARLADSSQGAALLSQALTCSATRIDASGIARKTMPMEVARTSAIEEAENLSPGITEPTEKQASRMSMEQFSEPLRAHARSVSGVLDRTTSTQKASPEAFVPAASVEQGATRSDPLAYSTPLVSELARAKRKAAVTQSEPPHEQNANSNDHPKFRAGSVNKGDRHPTSSQVQSGASRTGIREEIVQGLKEDVESFLKAQASEGRQRDTHSGTPVNAESPTHRQNSSGAERSHKIQERAACATPHGSTITHSHTQSCARNTGLQPNLESSPVPGSAREPDILRATSPHSHSETIPQEATPAVTSIDAKASVATSVQLGTWSPFVSSSMARELSTNITPIIATSPSDYTPVWPTPTAPIMPRRTLTDDTLTQASATHDPEPPLQSIETSYTRTETIPDAKSSSTDPLRPVDSDQLRANLPDLDTGRLILVDWKHKDNALGPISRLTRYNKNIWNAVKEDMPESFVGKKLAGLKPSMVSLSAVDVLEQYGESIANEALEDCIQFLMEEAYGDQGHVERAWRKTTVMMKD